MSDWKALQLKQLDFGAAAFADLIKKMAAYLSKLADIIDAFLQFVQEFDDPLAIVLKQLIEEINKLLSGLLDTAGGYVLHVPVGKRLMTNFLGLGDVTPEWAGPLGIFESDVSPVAWNNPGLKKLLTDANRYSGGNAGFFRIVLDSLRDSGDLNRPQFYNDDDYVGGLVLLTGTGVDPLGLLDDLWALSGLFNGPDTMPKVPRPKNLTAKVLRHTALDAEGSQYDFDAFLTWDPPSPFITQLKDLGGCIIRPDRYAILRCKNNVSALSANNIVDLMGKRELSKGDVSIDGSCTVIEEDNYVLTDGNYLDKNITAARDDVFYYAVAWKLKGFNADEVETTDGGKAIEYWHISNIARVVPYPTVPDSTFPNWHRTPSVAELFPPVAVMLKRLSAYVEGIANKIIGVGATFDGYVQALRDEVAYYEQLARNILAQIAKLERLFMLPPSGLYARSFSGSGGNRFFVSDLADSFIPKPGKVVPPFHRGDEYVTGVVLLAGGPQVNVEVFQRALSLFFSFGSTDSTASPAGARNTTYGDKIETDTLNATLDALDSALLQTEEVTFKTDMTKGVDLPQPTVFNTVTIKDIAQCKKPEVPVIVFGSNMEVIPNADV